MGWIATSEKCGVAFLEGFVFLVNKREREKGYTQCAVKSIGSKAQTTRERDSNRKTNPDTPRTKETLSQHRCCDGGGTKAKPVKSVTRDIAHSQ